ncbi:DUF6894 family protein [Microvirga aerophila]|uniref:DUF6894 domain-containing protein n=1 Tax=Microvirga aerophila TaxID=670291 RepID=A0A512C1K5_9HYPH|nr:hypothetical protein [Microvirga aerophila]GEO18098.1 hypothetical protein MAE02_57940 [Microvirga aerophila]
MPRYFFDTYDGRSLVPDEVGLDLKDLAAAKAEAQVARPDMARDALPDSNNRTFVISVRDEAEQVLVRIALVGRRRMTN